MIARRSGGPGRAPVDPIDADDRAPRTRWSAAGGADHRPASTATMMMMRGHGRRPNSTVDAGKWTPVQASARAHTSSGMAAPPAQQTPSAADRPRHAVRPTDTGSGRDTPRTLGNLPQSETGQNIPGSVKALGAGYVARSNQSDPDAGGHGVRCGWWHPARKRTTVGIPTHGRVRGSEERQAAAAGQYFQRYHPDNLTDTFRRDPAGVAVDALGALSGAGGAARGAMKLAPHMRGQDLMPPPQGAPQAAPTRMSAGELRGGCPDHGTTEGGWWRAVRGGRDVPAFASRLRTTRWPWTR